MSGKRIIIGDDSEDIGRVFEKYLNTVGYAAECVRNDCDLIYDTVREELPDIVILSVNLIENRIAELTLKIKTRLPKIKVIVLSYVASPKLCSNIINSGAERCVVMPVTLHELGNLLEDVLRDRYIFDFDPVIMDFLVSFGVKKNVSGFRYLCTAVGLCLMNPEYTSDITKKLYGRIAELHETQPQLVERSLRHLCDAMHKDGSDKRILGGRIMGILDKRLTNAELIIGVTDVFAERFNLY